MAEEFALSAPPVDVEKVAREMDATVVRRPVSQDVSGMLLRREGQNVIGLNSEQSPISQRFALAHLLGHLRMHRRRELILDTAARYSCGNQPSMPTDREEAEANRFAGALLAPEATVREVVADASFATSAELVGILAERFQMSTAAMGYRLMMLGIVMDI
jgi:Zn-dependent peptidase ImmA (M78 family)